MTWFVLVLVICINISTFEPNLHISQMTSHNVECETTSLTFTTRLHMHKCYANILANKFHPGPVVTMVTYLCAGRLEVPCFVVEGDDEKLVAVRVVAVVRRVVLARAALGAPVTLLHVGRVLGVGRSS